MVDQNNQTPADTTQQPESKTDSPDSAPEEKSVGGIKYYKEMLEKERVERERIASELNEIKTGKMKEQNQWKELYEQEQRKTTEATEKLKAISTNLVQDKMRTAIEREASKAGILPTALEDLDLVDKSMIEIETTSNGRINFHNVKEFVDSLKMKKPHWFGAGRDPSINNKKADYSPPTEMSPEDILNLQSKDPIKYNEVMRQRLGIKI
jgi:hypothetical protein